MIRSEAFDAINKRRLAILQALDGKEVDLGELLMVLGNGLSRSACYYHLQALKQAGLVQDKAAVKKNSWAKAKKTHKEVKRWFLTQAGEQALVYFGIRDFRRD